MDSTVTDKIERVLDVNDRQAYAKLLKDRSDLGLKSVALASHERNRVVRIELLAELTKVTLIEACKIGVTSEEVLKGVRLLEAQLQQSNLLLLLLSQLAESLLELRDSVTIERDESLTLLLLTLSLLLLREEALALLFLER